MGMILLALLSLLDLFLNHVPNGSIGCSNNNYASREQCKKCGQSKDEAAMPAISMPAASLLTYAHYFATLQGLYGSQMNSALSGSPPIQSLLPNLSWPLGENSKYGLQSALSCPLTQYSRSNTSQLLPAPRGWRNGDWMCDCGFHNYSSRSEVSPYACYGGKKCCFLF